MTNVPLRVVCFDLFTIIITLKNIITKQSHFFQNKLIKLYDIIIILIIKSRILNLQNYFAFFFIFVVILN